MSIEEQGEAATGKPDESRSGDDRDQNNPGLTLWQLIGSAISAAIGVQSSENRKRDFSRGRPGQFIAIGILFTVLFVLVMIGVVNLVLSAVS